MDSRLIVKSWTHISFLSQELLSIALGNCLKLLIKLSEAFMKPQGTNLQISHFKNSLPFVNSHGACKSHWLYITLKVCSLVSPASYLHSPHYCLSYMG